MAGLIFLLVFVSGYAVQRGTICAVAAIDDLIVEHRPQRFFGFLLCAAVALFAIAVAAWLGNPVFDLHHGSAHLLPPLIGGVMFGAGAWLNGRCAFGTVSRLGRGEAMYLGTLAGFCAGSWLMWKVGLGAGPLTVMSPLAAVPAPILVVAAGALALGLALATAIRPGALHGRGWSPLKAMTLIGAVNGVLLVIAVEWPYTDLLIDLARSTGMYLIWRATLAFIFLAGAVVAAISGGCFQPTAGDPRRWAKCTTGGFVMGIGATLVPGGNDMMLLVGLPMLLPSQLVAYLAMLAAIAGLLGGRIRATPRPSPA